MLFESLYSYLSNCKHLFKYTIQGVDFWEKILKDSADKHPKNVEERIAMYTDYFSKTHGRIPNFLEQNMFRSFTRDNLYIFCGYSYNVFSQSFVNCQNFTFSSIEDLLSVSKPTVQQKIDFIKRVAYEVGKRILICDIHQSKIPNLKELFPNFLFSSNYTSTNGSEMAIVGIVVN